MLDQLRSNQVSSSDALEKAIKAYQLSIQSLDGDELQRQLNKKAKLQRDFEAMIKSLERRAAALRQPAVGKIKIERDVDQIMYNDEDDDERWFLVNRLTNDRGEIVHTVKLWPYSTNYAVLDRNNKIAVEFEAFNELLNAHRQYKLKKYCRK